MRLSLLLVGVQWAGVLSALVALVVWEFFHPFPRWQDIWLAVFTLLCGAIGFFVCAFYVRAVDGRAWTCLAMGVFAAPATAILYGGSAEWLAKRRVLRREAGR